MGILDLMRKQFVDILDWTERPGDLAMRYPMQDREIQNGAQLTVRDGQVALFYDEGRVADSFGSGLHTLDTANLPVLSSVLNWRTGFRSPFKADVYFFTTKEQTGLKWGTPQPITVRDREFGPLRIRAFGSYGFRIGDVAVFAAKQLGTLEHLTVADLEPQLRGVINTAIASALGRGEFAFLDLAANQQALSDTLSAAVAPAFEQWGLTCTSFFVESVSLPDEVQSHLDKASSMRVMGDLNQYARFQAAEAIGTAAANESGMAGLGAGAAAGAAIGQTMGQALGGGGATAAPGEDVFAQIEKLHKLQTMGAITQDDYDAKKAALLAKLG